MMVLVTKARSAIWIRMLALNTAALAAQCAEHVGVPDRDIFQLYTCGWCEKVVCDLCFARGGGWCKGPSLMGGMHCYRESHTLAPLCSECAVKGGYNEQMCEFCLGENERDITGNYDTTTEEEASSEN